MVKNAIVAVIGAGPAGLMAAERLGTQSLDVFVFEAKPSPARKFLMAGRGGLNLTHSEDFETFKSRYGRGAAHLDPILDAFPPGALIAWANELGAETFVGTSGHVFPKRMKASPLLRAWLKRLHDQHVHFRFRHKWVGWNTDSPADSDDRNPPEDSDSRKPPELVFHVDDRNSGEERKHTFRADAVVLACGGATWPKLGATGEWTSYLQSHEVGIEPLQPHNTALEILWSPHLKEKFAGAPLKRIAMTAGVTTHRGEVVITQTGLEGGLAYLLNDAVKRELAQTNTSVVHLDLRPDQTHDSLARRLSAPDKRQSRSNTLRKAAKLSKQAIALLFEPSQQPLPGEPEALAQRIKKVQIKVTGLSQTDRAISTSGGVRLDAVDTNTMLKALPGVFVAGEMLDWDAPTGGYLLQATFATAVATAHGVSAWLARQGKIPSR